MPKLYTLGHSLHTLKEFINILHTYRIKFVVDVRSLPRSRRVPWFNKKKFQISLKKHKIGYMHMPGLGGLRHPKKDSVNKGWHNRSFRGFADYMQTMEFYMSLKKLNGIIQEKKNVVIVCAEVLPWRCHRSLIADAEIARHFTVWEIIGKTTIRKHKLTSFAVINRNKRPIQIHYPSDE